jgi:hypothetical protein
LGGNASPNQIALFTKMSDFILRMMKGQEKDVALWNFILTGFLEAKEVETGSSGKFLSEFKSGFLKLMGFGADYEEAKYYLGDFDVL